MKYHVVPMQEETKHDRSLESMIRKTAASLESEALKSIKASTKESTNPTLYYLYTEKSMQTLMAKINDYDDIILHGEGQPFVIGLAEESKFDLHPVKLAQLLLDAEMPDYNINITLLACHSASLYAPPKDSEIKQHFFCKFDLTSDFFG